MKFSPKCRAMKLGMIYTILGGFCSFFNWEGADIRPQIRKIPVHTSILKLCPLGISSGCQAMKTHKHSNTPS